MDTTREDVPHCHRGKFPFYNIPVVGQAMDCKLLTGLDHKENSERND